MRTSEPGDSGSGKFSDEAGNKSPPEKKRRRARFRRRVALPGPALSRPKLPRPRFPRPSLRRPALPRPRRRREKPPQATIPGPPPEAAQPRGSTGELWFRLVTRLRAIRYWLREKGGSGWKWVKRPAAALAQWWSRRSRRARIQIFTVAGVAGLYLILKFLPVPGVPCEISAAKECAPPDATISYVPRDAVLYAHFTVNSGSHQWDLAGNLADELPNLVALVRSDTNALPVPAARPIDLSTEVMPWAKDDLALVGVPGPDKTTAEAYVVGIGDRAKAERFLAGLAPGGKVKHAKAGSIAFSVYSNGLATARSGDQALFGDVAAVRAALDAQARRTPRLEGSSEDAARSALPDVRLAEIYLSRAGVQRMLAGRSDQATQLDTFVDYGATSGMAASLRARDDGIEVNVVSELDAKLEKRSPTVFADLPRFDPALASEASPDALGYIGVGDLGPAINKAIASAGATAQGLVGSLQALAARLRQEAGVDPLRDLLPALGGQAALVAEPTGGVPYASLIVDGVDEKQASQALASLQRPLLRSIQAGAQVPSFQSKDVDGVTVHSLQISPAVDLSYAVFDGKLVVSTEPEGIAQVRSSGDNLAGAGDYQAAVDRLPGSVSALVFLNLDEVLGLVEKAGLAEDPLFASVSGDISRIRSLGLAVRGSHSELHSELFLAIHKK